MVWFIVERLDTDPNKKFAVVRENASGGQVYRTVIERYEDAATANAVAKAFNNQLGKGEL